LAVTTAPATLGTLFKASHPLMEVLARPTTTATRVASRLFPSLSRALPYTEMADRGFMGYMGARGVYDAGKGWYQGTMPWYQAVPQMALSGLMMADAAPLVGDIPKNVGNATEDALLKAASRLSPNIKRRAAESFMRTSPSANPFPDIKYNFHLMMSGKSGGRQRLAHIANYILTGKKVGPKGYYNSFAFFQPTNFANFVKRPTLA